MNSDCEAPSLSLSTLSQKGKEKIKEFVVLLPIEILPALFLTLVGDLSDLRSAEFL